MIELIIKLFQGILQYLGIEATRDETIYLIVGAILGTLVGYIPIFIKFLFQKSSKIINWLIRRYRLKPLLNSIEFKNVFYFHIYPPINTMLGDKRQIECSIDDASALRFAPPKNINQVIKKVIKNIEKINEKDDLFKQRYSYYKKYVSEKGHFSQIDHYNFEQSALSELEVFKNLISDQANFEKIKEKVFVDFLFKKEGFHFNGEKLALSKMIISRDEKENEKIILHLFKTDYYSYRIITECSKSIREKFGLNDKLPVNRNELKEYFGQNFQKYIHLSLAVALIVHTKKDNRVIITRRSSLSANSANEAGLYFMSANEALNINDVLPDNYNINLNLVIQRALNEEIIGTGNDTLNLISKIEKCLLTGVILYLPNLSIGLCFYISIDCYSEDIRNNYFFARDARFETINIINEKKWGKNIGLPKFDNRSICRFVKKTVDKKKLDLTWDEGTLITLLLSNMVV